MYNRFFSSPLFFAGLEVGGANKVICKGKCQVICSSPLFPSIVSGKDWSEMAEMAHPVLLNVP